MPDNAQAARTERNANRQFLPSPRRARQQQAGYVAARNHQYKTHCGHHHGNAGANAEILNQIIWQRAHSHAPAFFDRREAFFSAASQRDHLCARLLESHDRLQPCIEIQGAVLARGLRLIRGVQDERRPQLRDEAQQPEIRGHHADNRVTFPVKPDGAPDEGNVGTESPFP